jgi:hypothetical protein
MSILDKVFRWLGHGRYWSSLPTAAANGDIVELLVDGYGRLQVVNASAAPAGVTATRQLAAANTGSLKAAGAGSLVEVTLWNSGAAAIWFQIHDKASAVSGGDACIDQIMVPAGGSVGWRPAVPVAASAQLRWAASTTAATYTAPGAACVGFSAAVM